MEVLLVFILMHLKSILMLLNRKGNQQQLFNVKIGLK